MSFADIPEMTDPEKILKALDELNSSVSALNERLDRQAEGLNTIGSSVNWIVQNVQGVFQMFQSPMFLQQVSSMMGSNNNDD